MSERPILFILALFAAVTPQVASANPNVPPPEVPWVRDHIEIIAVNDGIPILKQIEGKSCLETTGRDPNRFIYFNVEDNFAFGIDETIEVEIEYDASVSGIIFIQYDSNYTEEKYDGKFHRSEAVKPKPGPRWVRHTFKLDRARFEGHQHHGADFRLSSPNGIVRISDLIVRRPELPTRPASMGTLKLRILDASTGKTTPARVGIYDTKGRFKVPSNQAVPINIYFRTERMYNCRNDFTWPLKNTYAFYVDGEYECELVPGKYQLVVRKGIEYHLANESVTIEADKTLEHTVTLKRWADMPAKGWYSGDAHVHIGRTREQNPAVLAQIEAEDIHVANLVQMGDIGDYYFRQYAWGQEGRYQQGDYVLAPGHEDPRTPHRGHTLFLNIKSMIRDDATYFLYHKAFEQVHKQGGLVGYAHRGENFNAQRGMAIDMPFHLVDLVEVLQMNYCGTKVWFDFLNLGYKLVPIAGSDFPYLDAPGQVRSYVHIAGEFSAQAWFDSLAKGYTFVTNGPMLTFTVNGVPMGSELTAQPADELKIEASVAINPDIDQLATLKLIAHGETIKTFEIPSGLKTFEVSHTLTVDKSSWLAIRVEGKKSVAHTAPVYVVVNNKRFWKPSAVPQLVAEQRKFLRDLVEQPAVGRVEKWLQEELTTKWAQQKPLVEERVKKAHTRYDALLKTLSTESQSRTGAP